MLRYYGLIRRLIMGCGCGGQPMARRSIRSVVKAPTDGVLRAVATNNGASNTSNESQALKEERRKVEKLRRDAILRALGRP
jgi:hypothetical protein